MKHEGRGREASRFGYGRVRTRRGPGGARPVTPDAKGKGTGEVKAKEAVR